MKSDKKQQNIYLILMILVTIIWGYGFIVTVNAIDAGYSISFILLVRFFIAAVFFGIAGIKNIVNCNKIEVFGGLICGALLFLGFFFQTYGLPLTTPSNNAMLTSTAVIFIPLFLWLFFKQKPTKNIIIGAVVCFIGVCILSVNFSDIGHFGLGDLLSIACAVSFALQAIFMSYFATRGRVDVLNFFQMLMAAAMAAILFLIVDKDFSQFKIKYDIMWVLYLAFLSTIFAYYIQTKALVYLSASRVGIITAPESLVASLFSIILGYESVSSKLIIGGTLVFIAILIVEKPKTDQKEKLK